VLTLFSFKAKISYWTKWTMVAEYNGW